MNDVTINKETLQRLIEVLKILGHSDMQIVFVITYITR